MIVKAFFTACVLLCLTQLSYASIKVTSYNIRNFGRSGSFTDLIELKTIINDLNSDILGVQEIVSISKFKNFIDDNFINYNGIFSKCGGRGEQHLGILYNKNKFKLIETFEEDELSYITLESESPQGCTGSLRPILIGKFKELSSSKDFIVMVVHLKAGGGWSSITRRAKQYKIISKTIKRYESKGHQNIIVMGDFNTTGYIPKNSDFKNFQYLISSSQTFDISSKISCTSYWSGVEWDDNIEEPSILDHILFSRNINVNSIKDVTVDGHCKQVNCKTASDYELGTSYLKVSDHCPISAKIN